VPLILPGFFQESFAQTNIVKIPSAFKIKGALTTVREIHHYHQTLAFVNGQELEAKPYLHSVNVNIPTDNVGNTMNIHIFRDMTPQEAPKPPILNYYVYLGVGNKGIFTLVYEAVPGSFDLRHFKKKIQDYMAEHPETSA